MPAGLRVYTSFDRPDEDLVARFAPHNSADLSDVLHKSGTMDGGLQQIYRPMRRFVGVAVTASLPTGALTMLKMAVQQTRPGDVLVVNAYGNSTTAIVGGNVCRGMAHRGLAGMIVDGAIRDVSEIREDDFPVLARSIATGSSAADGPGEVNVPIACGNVVVFPGDIIVADEDGIAVVRPADAEDVLERIKGLKASHAAAQEILLRGQVTGIDSIEDSLRAAGCEIIDRDISRQGA